MSLWETLLALQHPPACYRSLSGPSGPKCSGSVPQGVFGALRAPGSGVSKKCPRSVPRVSPVQMSGTQNQPNEEVLGQTSLQTSRQKLRSSAPICTTKIGYQEWPRQTKPKKGQFMNFSRGGAFRNKSSIFVKIVPVFLGKKTRIHTKTGEIHELFVLALYLVWFAGATPDWRCAAAFPFLPGLAARRAQRYKWGAYCSSSWRCIAACLG